MIVSQDLSLRGLITIAFTDTESLHPLGDVAFKLNLVVSVIWIDIGELLYGEPLKLSGDKNNFEFGIST
jgi:hypothetical protein